MPLVWDAKARLEIRWDPAGSLGSGNLPSPGYRVPLHKVNLKLKYLYSFL